MTATGSSYRDLDEMGDRHSVRGEASTLLFSGRWEVARNGVFQNDTFNRQPSWWCPISGHVPVVKFLRQAGCDPEQSGDETGPPNGRASGQPEKAHRHDGTPDRRVRSHCRRSRSGGPERGRSRKIHDLSHSAYSTYAKATALRREKSRRSADVTTAQLAEAKKVLNALSEAGASLARMAVSRSEIDIRKPPSPAPSTASLPGFAMARPTVEASPGLPIGKNGSGTSARVGTLRQRGTQPQKDRSPKPPRGPPAE